MKQNHLKLESWELEGLEIDQENYPWERVQRLTEGMLLAWLLPECGEKLLQHFGTLPCVLNAKKEELLAVPEVEAREVFQVTVLRELILRTNQLQKCGLYRVQNERELSAYVVEQMRRTTEAEMWVMVLDKQGYVLEWARVWREGEVWLRGEAIWQVVKKQEGAQSCFVARSNKGVERVTLADEELYQFLRKSEGKEGVKLKDYQVISEQEAITLNYWK